MRRESSARVALLVSDHTADTPVPAVRPCRLQMCATAGISGQRAPRCRLRQALGQSRKPGRRQIPPLLRAMRTRDGRGLPQPVPLRGPAKKRKAAPGRGLKQSGTQERTWRAGRSAASMLNACGTGPPRRRAHARRPKSAPPRLRYGATSRERKHVCAHAARHRSPCPSGSRARAAADSAAQACPGYFLASPGHWPKMTSSSQSRPKLRAALSPARLSSMIAA